MRFRRALPEGFGCPKASSRAILCSPECFQKQRRRSFSDAVAGDPELFGTENRSSEDAQARIFFFSVTVTYLAAGHPTSEQLTTSALVLTGCCTAAPPLLRDCSMAASVLRWRLRVCPAGSLRELRRRGAETVLAGRLRSRAAEARGEAAPLRAAPAAGSGRR